jgi:hypothetical protein
MASAYEKVTKKRKMASMAGVSKNNNKNNARCCALHSRRGHAHRGCWRAQRHQWRVWRVKMVAQRQAAAANAVSALSNEQHRTLMRCQLLNGCASARDA